MDAVYATAARVKPEADGGRLAFPHVKRSLCARCLGLCTKALPVKRLAEDLTATKSFSRFNGTKLPRVNIQAFAWSRTLWPLVDER